MAGVPFTLQSPDGLLTLERKNGTAVFQGDILLTEAQVETLRGGEGHTRASNVSANGAGLATLSTMWPGETVYYVINGALPNTGRVTGAIAHWQATTNVRFVQRTTQRNYVEFVRGTGCSSQLGMVGGKQNIELADGCDTGSAIHEIGHAVGLLHEQTRRDRDSHVLIQWNNIQSGYSHNFQRYDQAGRNGFDSGPFDFSSIMMYDSYAFSSNGLPTITRLDGSTFGTNRNALSSGDLGLIGWLYGGLYASVDVVETERYDETYHVYVAADHSIRFWADRSRTIPATLSTAVQVNYESWYHSVIGNQSSFSRLTANLQPGSHSYYLGNQVTQDCYYGANGSPENLCYSTWLSLKDGFGYATGY
ncbi:M12 family metallopeptidase [Myxococcus fulvus]|uniref:M12 family metallopeptidase n=1 Tax=Myxococcus fulvus TaxID=33 RepID=UPI003B9DFA05